VIISFLEHPWGGLRIQHKGTKGKTKEFIRIGRMDRTGKFGRLFVPYPIHPAYPDRFFGFFCYFTIDRFEAFGGSLTLRASWTNSLVFPFVPLCLCAFVLNS
jgi:hypothetical protein